MKILSPTVHGVIDYLVVPVLLFGPTLFGFGGTVAATICYVLAVFHALMSATTAYPMGIARIIPFTVHAGIEVAATVFLFAAPWLFGFADNPAARNFFLVSGASLALVYVLTDYKAADRDYELYHHGGRVSVPVRHSRV